jgi:hypothetical protein
MARTYADCDPEQIPPEDAADLTAAFGEAERGEGEREERAS